MQKDTINGVARLIATDPETTPEQATRLVALLQGSGKSLEKPRPITARHAGEILDCCTRTVYRYAAAGHLDLIRHSPRRIRFDRRQVERLAFEGVQS